MREALSAAQPRPAERAALAGGRLRRRIPALRPALDGRVPPPHRLLLRPRLPHRDVRDQARGQGQAQRDHQLEPSHEALTLLPTSPGRSARTAAASRAESGGDMTRFASATHRAAWAGRCPGNTQSGGKRLHAGTTSGNRWVRGVFGAVAWVRSHPNDTSVVAQFQRIARRRGPVQALSAVAHTVLVSISPLLTDKRPSTDVGAAYFDTRETARLERQHVRRREHVGSSVTLTPAVA
jgi:transposase